MPLKLRSLVVLLVSQIFVHAAFPAEKPLAIIDAGTVIPVNKARQGGFKILYINPLRFAYSVSATDTPIAAPAVPGAIAPSAIAGSLPTTSTARTQLHDGGKCDDYSTGELDASLSCVIQDLGKAGDEMLNVTKDANSLVVALAKEQRCYREKVNHYSSWRLTGDQATDLLTFARNNTPAPPPATTTALPPATASTSCRSAASFEWPLKGFQEVEKHLGKIQQNLLLMTLRKPGPSTTDLGYDAWSKQAGNADALKAINSSIAANLPIVQKNEAEPAGFSDAVVNVEFWRDRLASIVQKVDRAKEVSAQKRAASQAPTPEIDETNGPFVQEAKSNCDFAWYGRGDTQTLSLSITDISATPATTTTAAILINSCYPTGTVSTGIGVSFVHDNVYAFEPSPNPANTSTTISTVQKTTDAAATPLYVLQYNASFKDFANGFGVHGSFGAGAGSTSGTTNLEFVVGPALSFRRRTFFLTPALQIARRDQLLPGYSVNSPKNDLQALPIVTNWKLGFALTFTLGLDK